MKKNWIDESLEKRLEEASGKSRKVLAAIFAKMGGAPGMGPGSRGYNATRGPKARGYKVSGKRFSDFTTSKGKRGSGADNAITRKYYVRGIGKEAAHREIQAAKGARKHNLSKADTRLKHHATRMGWDDSPGRGMNKKFHRRTK